MNGAEFVAWIEANVALDKDQTALDAALWFAAYHDASAIFDSYTVKELARELQSGGLSAPSDIDELTDWLSTWFEEGSTETVRGEEVETLLMAVSAFFSVE